MTILEVIMVRDCLDGSMFKDVVLDAPLSRTFIRSLANLGALEYFPHLPRPFFRVTRSGEFVLKGVQGAMRFQAMFVHHADRWEEVLRRHVEGLPNVPDALPSGAAPPPAASLGCLRLPGTCGNRTAATLTTPDDDRAGMACAREKTPPAGGRLQHAGKEVDRNNESC